MRDYLMFFAPNSNGNIFSNETFLMFIIGPLTLLFSILALLLGGLFAMFYSLQANFWWWLFGLLFMWTFALSGGIALAQFFQMLKTIIFLPVVMDSNVIKTIIRCNIRGITVVYGWLVCGAAFDSIDPNVAMYMAITYCVILVKMFWSDAKAAIS